VELKKLSDSEVRISKIPHIRTHILPPIIIEVEHVSNIKGTNLGTSPLPLRGIIFREIYSLEV